MPRTLVCLLLVCAAAVPLRAELPATLDELVARHEADGKEQLKTLKLWFDACFVYMNPDTRREGRRMIQYLTIPLKDDDDWDRQTENQIFVERLQKVEYQHIWRSYAIGATVDNGYAMEPDDYALRVAYSKRDTYGRGWVIGLRPEDCQLRDVYLKQQVDTRLWFVSGYANLYGEVPPPK